MIIPDKKIGLWGMGVEGQASKAFVQKTFKNVDIVEIDESNLDDLYDCDLIIKSPGVSLYRPEISLLKTKFIPVVSACNLFLAYKDINTKVIAITGTKGKSTTATLTYHTLKNMGYNVALGGNIGTPLLTLLDEKYDYVVMEVSSYQSADLKGDIDIACLTNLYPEHLQWHTSHEIYYKDKINTVRQAKKAIVKGNDDHIKSLIDDIDEKNITYFNTHDSIHIQDNMFMDGKIPLFSCDDLSLKGVHNQENACIVLSILKHLNCNLLDAKDSFKTMQALPHRLQIVHQTENLTVVDDAISTTPESAVAALNTFNKGDNFITLIVGGFDRNPDFTPLINALTPLKNQVHLVCMPDTGITAHTQAVAHNIPTTYTPTMTDAVKTAIEKTPQQKNSVILLSPASPSYNAYKNYIEKGQDFTQKIKESLK